MRKLFYFICLLPTFIWGVIVESDKMEEILPYLNEETWVLIDVDNTLIESSLHMGSAQWRGYIRQKAYNVGFNQADAETILDQFWLFVQPLIPVRLVDPYAPILIKQLESAKTVAILLTARDPVEAEHTQKQLASVGISMHNGFFPERMELQSDALSLYEKGVIYCGDNTKSQAFFAFMQSVKRTPKRVVLIDDRAEQVESLKKSLEKMGVEFIGIRFSASDKRVRSFDPKIADLQFSLLPKIVSDEEAKALLFREE